MLHPELRIIDRTDDEVTILKRDARKGWPDDNCSDERLAFYLDVPVEKIKRVQFIDRYGIGDGITIYFTTSIVIEDGPSVPNVNQFYRQLSNTHKFFLNLSRYIQTEQGKTDSVAVKIGALAEALGNLDETDVIQILYHAQQMNKI